MEEKTGIEEPDAARIVFHLYMMSQVARFRGLLALEDYRDEDLYEPLQKGLDLVMEGTDPDEVSAYYERLVSGKQVGDEYAVLDMLRRGVGMVQYGEDPDVLRWQLSSLMGDRTVRDVVALLLEYEREKHAFFPDISQAADDTDRAGEVEDALLYESAWRAGFVTAMVTLEVLAAAVRACAPHLQMRVLHSLPLIEGREFMRRYRAGIPGREERAAAMELFLKWFRFARGDGEFPGGPG